MTELLTDIPDLHNHYAAGVTDMVALYATLAPLVDDGTLEPDTANDILDYAAALHNVNAVLADVAVMRDVAVELEAERARTRVHVPRWVTPRRVLTGSITLLVLDMVVALVAMMV